MLHNPKPKNVRSVETIRNNTEVINTFEDHSFLNKIFEVRKLSNRKNKDTQHFIVIDGLEISNLKNSHTVKSMAEVAIRDRRMYFVTLPDDFVNKFSDSNFLYSVELAVCEYMFDKFHVHVRVPSSKDLAHLMAVKSKEIDLKSKYQDCKRDGTYSN